MSSGKTTGTTALHGAGLSTYSIPRKCSEANNHFVRYAALSHSECAAEPGAGESGEVAANGVTANTRRGREVQEQVEETGQGGDRSGAVDANGVTAGTRGGWNRLRKRGRKERR